MSYVDFARFYDLLTENVDYKAVSKLYTRILKERGVSSGRLLDLACGSGSLSLELEKAGFEVVGSDLSEEMLTVAALKSNSINLIRADMTNLPFKNEFEGIICGLDSINHLPNMKAVSAAFNCAYNALKKGGIFAADMNAPYKHRVILGNNAFNFDYEGLFCAWQNELCEEDDTLNRVDMFLDFFEEQEDGRYIRYQDSISEIAPDIGEVRRLLELSGFSHIEVLDYPSGEALREDSEKYLIIGKKD